jgi:hypothetical protein
MRRQQLRPSSTAFMSKVKILFFAADPHSVPPHGRADRLLLDEDIRQIREKVRASEHRDALEFDYRLAARQDDLLQALNEVQPDVVHFSGHGWSEGLFLMDSEGRRPLGADVGLLTELFRVFRGRIRVVVLNACLSHSQAEAVARVVGCAIGMHGKISDQAAITFGAAFYRAIGFGHSVQTAFDQACLALPSTERDCPRIAARPDVDPARLVLVAPTKTPSPAPARPKRATILLAAAVIAPAAVYLAFPKRSAQPGLPSAHPAADTAAARPASPTAAALPIRDPAGPPPPASEPRGATQGGGAPVVRDSASRPLQPPEPGNAIQNGGFESRFAGWTRSVDGRRGKGTNEIVSFADARSGYALHLAYEGKGSLVFAQKVSVAGPDYVFRGTFRASSHEGAMIGFSGTGIATVMLQYLDENGRVLGITSFYSYVTNPFDKTPLVGVPRRGNGGNQVHYIDVDKERLYRDYELDIRREIEENLLGAVAEQVRAVTIALYCGATDHGARAELWVTDLSLRPKG